MSQKTELHNNILYQSTLKWMAGVIELSIENLKKATKKGEVRVESGEELNIVDDYTLSVYERLNSISNSIDQIKESIDYIIKFDTVKNYEEWLTYHYSYYSILYVSLFDMVLILINEVYRTGLRPQECNERTVLKNRLIAKKIKKSCKSISKLVQQYKYQRNLFVHRGIKPNLATDKSSKILDQLFFIHKWNPDAIDKNDGNGLKYTFVKEIDKIASELDEELDELKNEIDELFKLLHPVFINQLNLLKVLHNE